MISCCFLMHWHCSDTSEVWVYIIELSPLIPVIHMSQITLEGTLQKKPLLWSDILSIVTYLIFSPLISNRYWSILRKQQKTMHKRHIPWNRTQYFSGAVIQEGIHGGKWELFERQISIQKHFKFQRDSDPKLSKSKNICYWFCVPYKSFLKNSAGWKWYPKGWAIPKR